MKVQMRLSGGILVLALAIALGLAAAAGAVGATLQVDNTDPSCGTAGHPYCTIQAAVNAASAGDTIQVAAGTYHEDVLVDKSLTLQGAGIDQTIVSGVAGGDSATIRVASNVVVSGFTITRDGNSPATWNDPTLNSAGLAVQGQSNSVDVSFSKFTGNRTGIDVNNSNGNSIHNDVIVDNRTGLIFRNQTDGTGLDYSSITGNWTVGVLFLDASGGTNSPVQQASNSAFNNNDISGNWYGQVVDRQAGGSLPAPGTNVKDFSGNWYGTNNPRRTNADSSEPGYSSQIPVEFGGTATPPATAPPEIAGPGSANIDYTPFLWTGTDTSATAGFQEDLSQFGVTADGAQVVTSGRIQEGVGYTSSGGTVHVLAGTYHEDVLVDRSLTLQGAGIDQTIVSGVAGGDGATIRAGASNVIVDGFTITRDGNSTATWNDPTLNSTGVAIIGQALTGLEVRNCKLTGNRTGIDVNNSNGNSIHNDLIVDNRTGLVFRNQTDDTTLENNSITGNWTLGVVFLDGSGGTGSPVQSAASSSFFDNDISGNWYGQVVDRQAGGSLPAPGTNVKNFSGNWYGTNSPTRTTADSTEPGYASQIPVEFGGTATAPATAPPQIEGPASANIDYTPFLWTGTDTDSAVGFQGDFSKLGVTADGAQSGATGRIQEGVDDVTTGGTVHALAGTYAESVSIGKKLTLDGAGDTTVIDPSSGPAIAISGLDETISHLKTTGATGGGNAGSGIEIVGATTNLTISHVTSTGNSGHGLAINTTGAIASLTLDTVDFSSNTGDGVRFPTSLASLNGLTISDSHFDTNGYAGMEIYGPPSTGPFHNVTITDSTFSSDTTKGIYAERLSDATLDGVTVDESGDAGSFAAGIDLNLKSQSFSNITIKNSTIKYSGTGDTTNGVGIAIKSRDDGTYGPTSVDGVTLTGNTITNNQVGIRFGEPGKNNVGPTGVKVNGNTIAGNVSAGFLNLTQTNDDATCDWWGSASGPTNAGNPGGTGDAVSGDVTFAPWETSPGGGCNGGLQPAGFAAGGSFTTYGTSDSRQVTVPSVANRVLVFVFAGKVGGDALSSVTYAGRPLQQLAARDEHSVHLELRYLVNPPVGTAALAWSKTGASQNITWGYTVYSGVDQTTPFGTPAQAGGIGDTAAAKSVAVATVSGDTVVDGVVFNDSTVASGPSAGSGQNQRWSTRQSTTQGGSSDRVASGASTTTSWTPAPGSTNSLDWALIAAPLHAAGAAGGGPQASTTTTVASTTSNNVAPGTAVSDTATVTGGGPTPTGTVSFFLCQPATVAANGGDCHAGGSQVGAAKPVAGGHATSDTTTATTTPGSYCWRAEYSGDANYNPSSDGTAANECFTVVATSPGGGPLTFQAASSFTVYGKSDSRQVTVPNVTDRALVFVFAGKFGGDTLTSVTYGGQPLQPLGSIDRGSVHLELRGLLDPPVGTAALAWSKNGSNQNITWGYSIYSGVASFGTAATNGGTDDQAGVKSVTAAGATGDLVVDGAVFNMGPGSSGPNAVSPQNQRWSTRISTTQGGSSDRAASGASTTMSWAPANGSTSGDWALAAVPLLPSSGGGGGGPQPSTVQTASSTTAGNVSPGTSVTDTATVTGAGPTPTGTVTFFLCQPATVSANGGDCHTGGSQVGATKPLDGSGQATSDATTSTTAVGTYCWRAEYSGDGNYNPSMDGSAAGECFTTASPAGGGPIGFETAGSYTIYGTSDSQQVTVPSASNRVLVFEFAGKFGGDALNSVTYGGQPLQALRSVDSASVHLELRYLVNPPAGTATLAWSKTGASQNITWGYSIYSGVNQSTPFGTSAGVGGAGDSPTPKSVTVAAPTGTAVVDAVVFNDGTVTSGPTAGGGQNQRWSTRISTTQGGSSDKPGSGSTTVTWTPANGSGTVDWALAAAPLQPAP